MKLLPLWISLGVIGAIILFGILPTMIVATYMFRDKLVRKSKKSWTRDCSWPQNAEQLEMFKRGEKWGQANDGKKTDVDIISEGFHLYGEFFNFGFDKSVIIIPGRTEGCHYSHYFAVPYPEAGYNVLVIDNRSHGLSDGKYNSLGLKEYRDVINWGKLLNEKFAQKEVVLHGICIGSATALYTLLSKDTPDYFTCMIADGMYLDFKENFKNHCYELHHPAFPVAEEVMLLIRLFCGVNAVKYGPVRQIDKLKKPILMLYTKQDKYCPPEDAAKLYEKCAAPKRVVWFEKGAHSHIRINDEQGYDNAIKQFLSDYKSL